jgi:hypothetical protein
MSFIAICIAAGVLIRASLSKLNKKNRPSVLKAWLFGYLYE